MKNGSLRFPFPLLPENPPESSHRPRGHRRDLRVPVPERRLHGHDGAGQLRLHVRIYAAGGVHGQNVCDDVL